MEKKRSIAEISATGNGSQVPVSNSSGTFTMTDYDADGLPYDSTYSTKDMIDANAEDIATVSGYVANMTDELANKADSEDLKKKADRTVDGSWDNKTWTGLTNFNGSNVWKEGDNIYYSSGTSHYKLNKQTGQWSSQTWYSLTNFNGIDVWTDGTDIYYSAENGEYVYKLNKTTSTWSSVSDEGDASLIAGGRFVWNYNGHTYYSYRNKQYELINSEWVEKTWLNMPRFFDGNCIWHLGNQVYFNYDLSFVETSYYKLNEQTQGWEVVNWSVEGDTGEYPQHATYGYNVWTDGINIYCDTDDDYHYVLDLEASMWKIKSWGTATIAEGMYVWSDGNNTYYSYNGTNYILKHTTTIEDSITIKSNGDIQGAGEILDDAGNALSEKYDANSLAFQNFRLTIPSSGWSSTAVDGYYTQTVTLPYPVNTYKKVDIDPTGADDSTDQTSAEAVAYSCLKHFRYAEGTGVTSATLYATSKPTTTFYIMVSGYYMTKNAASSGVALDITTANKLNVYDANGNKVAEFNGSATVNIYYRSKIVSVPSTGWSSVVDANGYYTQSIDLVDNYNSYDTPDIYLCGSTNDTKATAAEQAAWSLIDNAWMADSTATHTLVLYAKTKPTTTFYIRVKGSYIG